MSTASHKGICEDPRKAVAIWGASGHARVVADIVRLIGVHQIVGFLDDVNPNRRGSLFCGASVLGGQEQLDLLINNGITSLILAFGDNESRLRLSDLILSRGFSLISVVHPAATVADDAQIGVGTVVAAGAIINPACRIGRNTIINTSAIIDHECMVEDGAHISPGACLAGRVEVGKGSWIGVGAVIKDGIRIGSNTIIGAGAVVVDDIPSGVKAYGVPARVMQGRANAS